MRLVRAPRGRLQEGCRSKPKPPISKRLIFAGAVMCGRLAGPQAVSSRVASYSFTARLDFAGSRSLHHPRLNAVCYHLQQSGSHRLQSLRRQPDWPQCTPRRLARTSGEKRLLRGSARYGRARTPNDTAQHPPYRACRTSDMTRTAPVSHQKRSQPKRNKPDQKQTKRKMPNSCAARCDPVPSASVQTRSNMRYRLLAAILIGAATPGGCTEGLLDPAGRPSASRKRREKRRPIAYNAKSARRMNDRP